MGTINRILICGSRGWRDPQPIEEVIYEHRKLGNLVVIHGDAPKGADRIADRIARKMGVKVIREPADWGRHGKAAGPIRNQKMLDEHKPDYVYAFRAHGKSNGTDDMCARAQRAGVPVMVTTEAVVEA